MSEAVRSMFSAIAWRYDLANRAISLGQDQGWRRALAAAALEHATLHGNVDPERRGNLHILDCACGSGDVCFRLLREMRQFHLRGLIVGVDFSAEMLELARAKAARAAYSEEQVQFTQADILALPYPDASFDACTIAFGVRNLDDARAGIREMARVLRPGAPLCILETGHAANPLLSSMQRAWNRYAVPLLGGLISGKFSAYSYLNRTAAAFPSGQDFVALLETCEVFSRIRARPLSGGVVWLYTGVVR